MTNPPLPISPLRKDPNGVDKTWAKAYITTTATTLLKTGPGVLHSVTFNKPVATGTCELDDAITNTAPFAVITTPATPQPVTLTYDVEFTTGLSVTTGTAAQDITIAFS